MRAARLERVSLALTLGAAFLVTAAAAGCGGGSPGSPAETSAQILEARYDDVFPDDRVLTVRIVMDEADWAEMQRDLTAKEYYRADLWIDEESVPDVAVRTKGSSSLMSAASAGSFRAGLKVDFNFFNASRSYHGLKKLVYNNGFSDPTLMREFLGYELMAQMGVPAPRACFVDLWVNDVHLGVYTQVEAVDAVFVGESFPDPNGNLFKPEIKSGALDWTEADVLAESAAASGAAVETAAGGPSGLSTTTAETFNLGGGELGEIIERLGEDAGWIPGITEAAGEAETASPAAAGGPPRPGAGPAGAGAFLDYETDYLTSVGLKTNEDSPDYSGLYGLLEVLDSDPAEVSADDLERVLDVDEVLRFLAVSVALVHLDNYIGMAHNYYLYEDGGRFSVIPWDLNMAFGGFSSGLNEEKLLGFYIDEPTAAAVDQYPLVRQLLDEPEYLETYHGYLRQLVEGPFSVETMTARIDEIACLIRPYVQKDGNLLYTLEAFEQGLSRNLSVVGGLDRMGGDFIGLTYFVAERAASIEAQLDGESPAASGDGNGNGGVRGLAGLGGQPPGAPPGGWAPGDRE